MPSFNFLAGFLRKENSVLFVMSTNGDVDVDVGDVDATFSRFN